MVITNTDSRLSNKSGCESVKINIQASLYIFPGEMSYCILSLAHPSIHSNYKCTHAFMTIQGSHIQFVLGLYIVYFKRYNVKYHDTHEPIFDTYQQYILSCFRPKT